jgi:hypothetical protein
LIFEFSANGKATGTTVTARVGDDVLAVDKLDITKAKLRADFADLVCDSRPGINRNIVVQMLTDQAAQFARRQSEAKEKQPEPGSQELLQRMPDQVRDEARAVLESPDLIQHVLDDVAACGVAGERELVAAIYLVGVSRLLPRPLAAIVQAPSSTGKSYVVDKTAALFPAETVIHATAMTAQCLYYLPAAALRHKFIVAGERSRKEDDDTADATRALREMIGSGRLTKLVPMKEGGRIVTHQIEQPGPIAYIETTTLTRIFDEDANRCLLLTADERQQQTAHIVNRLADGYTGAVRISVDTIIQRHHAMQRMIRSQPVVIPFAHQIAARFDTERVEARRAFPHLMSMVETSALLHQFQRTIDGDGRIVASVDDYQLARHLVRGPLARLLGGRISDAAIRFYDRLISWAGDKFTTAEAYRHDRKSEQAIRGWLRELANVGGVEQIEPSRGSRPAVWRLTGLNRDDLLVGDCGLMEPEEITT